MGAILSATPSLALSGGTLTGDLTVNGTVTVVRPAAASTAYAAKVTGDAVNRYTVGADGKLQWGDGTAALDTDAYRLAANLLQTDGTFQVLTNQNVGGNIAAITAGNGLRVKEGANAKQGTAVLVAGTVVVADTSVTATSRIFLTSQADGGTPGFLRVSARTAATSFTITSSNAADTSTVAYEIFEPA